VFLVPLVVAAHAAQPTQIAFPLGKRRELPMPLSAAELFKRTAIFVAVALVPVLVWLLFDVILIAVGAILIAILLTLGAEPFTRWFKLPHTVALVISGCFIISIFGLGAYLFGTRAVAQLQQVLHLANQAVDNITTSLQGSELGKLILSHVQGGNFSLANVVTGVFSVSLSFITALVIVVFGGIYLAAQVGLYRDGLIQLLPHRLRANAAETLEDITNALRLWVLGQVIGMVLIGLLSTLATWFIGLPSPFALGLIAGLCEFIPYVGPILGAIPAVLVAATAGLDTALWTMAVYTLIQQMEGHLIAPLISREMVYIPPLVLILGIVTITTLFGLQAVIFAAPIVVILFVAVKKLYVRDSLGDVTPIPGEAA
jgi:predicted PurR-regulated permease PerM